MIPISFWHETVDLAAPRAPVEVDISVDVAIVGGGFCGLSTAWYLKQAAPALRVAVLEQQMCGYGASGRNAGFAMTLFGLTLELARLRFGTAAVRQAQEVMEAAVDHVGELAGPHGVDCDYERVGLLTVATTTAGVRRLRRETRLARGLGIDTVHFLDAAETRRRVDSPTYLAGRFEEHCALVNPAKLVRGLFRLAQSAGAEIYEQTPVIEVRRMSRDGAITLRTPRGQVSAQKTLFATNAYSAGFRPLLAKQTPVGTYIVLTEPLTAEQLGSIGWAGREGLEDTPNLFYYYRLTADNRLLMGGGDVSFKYGAALPADHAPGIYRRLEAHLRRTFPGLADARITHRWGGPVSVTPDMAPAFGWLGGDRRLAYALGCTGHGVALMTYAGQILRDLLLERRTPLSELFFVNRFTLPWPPEPLRIAAAQAIAGYMRAEDLVNALRDRRAGRC